TVRVAEIGGIEACFAHSRWSFAAAAIGKRGGMDAAHLILAISHDGKHGAIAEIGGLAVIGVADTYRNSAFGECPADCGFPLEHPAAAELAHDCVVEFRAAYEVIGAERHMGKRHDILRFGLL